MHHMLMRDVAIGEEHVLDLMLVNQSYKVLLGMHRYPIGIPLASQVVRIDPSLNARDLRCRKGYNKKDRVFAKVDVEVVEVTARGS